MLILTRRVGEAVTIGDDVTVTVLGVRGNQVRMGIEAPKAIAVHRQEVYKRIAQEREEDARQRGASVRSPSAESGAGQYASEAQDAHSKRP